MSAIGIVCPCCGESRHVNHHTRMRIASGESPMECGTCRRMRPSEEGMRWWIRRFGGTVPRGGTVAGYLSSQGLPSGLDELVASIRPSSEPR